MMSMFQSQQFWSRILLSSLILLWALEILFIQQTTTLPSWSMEGGRIFKDAARRLALNLCACTFLVCLLHRGLLYAVFVVGVVCSTILVAYANYFGAPLSWLTISYQWKEGLWVADHGLSLLSWPIVLLLMAAAAAKVGLREVLHRRPVSTTYRRRWMAVTGIAYVVLAIGMVVHKPLNEIKMGGPEYIFGYVVAWSAEAVLHDNDAILEDALAKAEIRSDKLTAQASPLTVGKHLVVVQVESLDFEAIDAEVNGQAVMPFLQQLKNQGTLCKVTPFHFTGSSEADFSLLTTSTPNGKVTPFQVVGFPYDGALPTVTRAAGYHSVAIHGNTGAFFHRRSAYQQMEFDELYFSEELLPLGVDVKEDDEVLQFSADLLSKATEPTFHFLITITSHGPFDRLPPDEIELFNQPETLAQAYLNSMRYVDRSLERYFEALPEDTTIVIYGDHHSNVTGYAKSQPAARDVPWLFCHKGGSNDTPSPPRVEIGAMATSGELGQLDLVCYLRDSLSTKTQVATRPQPANQR